MQKDKHLGLFIDRDTHYKLRYIARYEGRSASGEILYLLRQEIAKFEKENGEIKVPSEDEQ